MPTRKMTYDDDNRLLSVNGQGVSYDLDGNITNGPLPGGLNFYAYADGNPVSYLDPRGLAYGNPISGYGQQYPWDPFAPGGAMHVPSPWEPDYMTLLMTGAAVGVTVAGVVTIAAPAAVSGLTAIGLSGTAAKAVVTVGLYAGGAYGAYETITTTAQHAGDASVTGDWRAVAFDAGTILGGVMVGVSGGGRALAEGIMGRPSPAPNTWNVLEILEYEIANRYRFDLGPPGVDYWGSAPTPFSGGIVAGSIASGIGSSIQFVQNNSLYSATWTSTLLINK